MNVLFQVRIAVPDRSVESYLELMVPDTPPPLIQFTLHATEDGKEWFYECECGRAGISPFDAMAKEIPQEILSEMHAHAYTRH